MSVTTIALVLSIVGSLAELVGVVLIADRVADIWGALGRWWVRQRKRFRDNEDRLRALFPVKLYRLPGMAIVVHAKGVLGVSAVMSATVQLGVSAAGTVEERLERHRVVLERVVTDVSELKGGLKGRIREGAKDSPLGLALVIIGIAVLLVANVLSILAAS